MPARDQRRSRVETFRNHRTERWAWFYRVGPPNALRVRVCREYMVAGTRMALFRNFVDHKKPNALQRIPSCRNLVLRDVAHCIGAYLLEAYRAMPRRAKGNESSFSAEAQQS